MKKIITLVLALAMAVGLLAGCGGEEKKEVNITVKVPTIRMAPKNDSSVKDSYGFLVKAAESFQRASDRFFPFDCTSEKSVRRYPAA